MKLPALGLVLVGIKYWLCAVNGTRSEPTRLTEPAEHGQLRRAMSELGSRLNRIAIVSLDSSQLEDLAEAARKLHLALQYERLVSQTLTVTKVDLGQRLVGRAGEILHNLPLSSPLPSADGPAMGESLQQEVKLTGALLVQMQNQIGKLQLLAATGGSPGRALCREQRELLYRSSTSELVLDHWMTKAMFYSVAAPEDQQAGARLGDLWREVRVAYQAHRVVLAAVMERIVHFDVYTMPFVWNRVTKPPDRLAGWGPLEQALELPGGEELRALLAEFVHDFMGPLRPLLGALLSKAEVGSAVSPIEPLFPNVVPPQGLVKDEGGEWKVAEGAECKLTEGGESSLAEGGLFGWQCPNAATVRRQILGYKVGLLHWKQQQSRGGREEDPRGLSWNAILEYERLVEACLEEWLSRAGEQPQRGLFVTWELSYRALYTGVLVDLYRSIFDGRPQSVNPTQRRNAHLAAWEDDGGGASIRVELFELT